MVAAALGSSWTALFAAILGLALTATPASEPSAGAIELSWSADAACPQSDRARARIETFLGEPIDQVRGALSIEVTITEVDGGFVARIDTRTPEGHRRRALPRHADCALVGEAAALVVAMAIDPAVVAQLGDDQMQALQLGRAGEDTALADPGATSASPEPEPTPTPEPVRPDPRRASTSPSTSSPASTKARAPVFGWVRAAAEAGLGHVPAVDLGASLGLGVGHRRVRGEIVGHVVAPREVALDEGGATRFFAWAIGARVGIAAVNRWRFELPVLAGVELGQVRARGVNLTDARTANPLVAHLRAGAGARVRLHPNVALAFDLELLVALVRPSFSVDGHGVVYRPLPAGMRAALGLELRFPGRRRDGSGPVQKQTL